MRRMLLVVLILVIVLFVLLGCSYETSCLGCGPHGPRSTPQPRQPGPPLGVSTCQQMEDAINAPGIPPRDLQQRYRRDCL